MPERRRLPNERQAITHKMDIAGHEGYITVGLYEDGTPGELFINMSKEGSTISGVMDCFAIVASLALQYGVPLEDLCSKLAHTRFEPSGWTKNQDIKFAKSPMDYVGRWLISKFLKPPSQQQENKKAVPPSSNESAGAMLISAEHPEGVTISTQTTDAPACKDCGAITVRNGACYVCMNWTEGCS
jgi:ribonucleoside-diphosphate reductase alpha chain